MKGTDNILLEESTCITINRNLQYTSYFATVVAIVINITLVQHLLAKLVNEATIEAKHVNAGKSIKWGQIGQ